MHPKFKPRPGGNEWNILDDEEKEIFKGDFEVRRIGVIETNPWDFDINKSEIRIANTMCESDHVSKSWPEKLNSMQHIVVPNEFCRNTFLNSGVTTPITVIPHGTDTERYKFVDRTGRGKPFIFGISGFLDVTDRKGAFDLIRAFSSEFEEHEKVELWLKSSDLNFGFYSRFTDRRIHTFAQLWNFDQIIDFYSQIDCFVFPTKAEGIGYPPREAMATGLPTIITKWSGTETIAQEGISYPLAPKYFEPRPNFIEQDGNWAKIDIAELMGTMRHIFENQKEAIKIGKKGADWIRKNESWEKSAMDMKKFLERF